MAISPELRAFLARHATEPDALAAFYLDPEGVLGHSGLSDGEKEMVRGWGDASVQRPPPPTCPWSIHRFATDDTDDGDEG